MSIMQFMLVVWFWTHGHGHDEALFFAPSCEAARAAAEQMAHNARAEMEVISCQPWGRTR